VIRVFKMFGFVIPANRARLHLHYPQPKNNNGCVSRRRLGALQTPQLRKLCPVVACAPGNNTPPSVPEKTTARLSLAQRLSISLLTMTTTIPGVVLAAEETAAPESPLKALFKSLPLSLVHPLVMDGVLLGTLYAFYLGYQARTMRTTTDKELKMKLAQAKPGDRHYQIASILLAVMTVTTFEGMANTYTRTGKLFPGPHLYVGLASVALMSMMASLAPAMRRGNTAARNAHFAMAFAVTGGLVWQLQSGFEIVLKLLGWK